MMTGILREEKDIFVLIDGTVEECTTMMRNFITENEKSKSFPEMSPEIKESLYKGIFSRLVNPATPPELVNVLLNCLRIISRELRTLESALTNEYIQVILKVAKLKPSDDFKNCGDAETLEALKVIFNMTFQSANVRSMFISNQFLEILSSKVKDFSKISSWEIKYFTVRILFIMTALLSETAEQIRELNGLSLILEYMDALAAQPEPFDDGTVDLICEMLKVAYNLMHDLAPKNANLDELPEEIKDHFVKATHLVKIFLVHELVSEEKQEDIKSHSVDLLASIPPKCFELLIPVKEASESNFNGHDMAVIDAVVDFLDRRLDNKGDRRATLKETLSPVLWVLLHMASKNAIIRKYLKLRILPPLKKTDVLERPEVGPTLRNRLCALMTSPAGRVTELVCNFLFVLVKENVKRFIKYTGFGNAAGLLANRGLLGGGKRVEVGVYSSESEDSDTEEYKEVSHLINGFGSIEPEHSPPCEGMTEEQKIVEAMKLVNAIDRLNRNQIIQPVQIGPDGRPQPIEHVCQLLDNSSESLIHSNQHQRSGSDSSD